MRAFGATRVIPITDRGQLWNLVGDLARHPDWAADAIAVVEIGPRRFASKSNARGRTFSARIEVLDAIPDREIDFRVHDQTGVYRHRITLGDHPRGVTVTRHVEPEALSFRQRVLAEVARRSIRIPAIEASLERLERAARSDATE
jgi:hypothetical protein